MKPKLQQESSIKGWHVCVLIVGLILMFILGGDKLANALLRMG